jgi:HK97 family phage major capsid protein
LGKALAAAADLGYLRGTGANNQPLGIRNQTGVQTVAATSDLYNDLVDVMTAVQAKDANPTGWICHPRVKGKLLKLKDTTGYPIFQTDMSAQPVDRLFGLPIIYSSQIPTNLGAGSNETEIYCLDGTQVVLAFWKRITLDATNAGAIWDGTRAVSAFQRDQTLVRAIMRVDIGLRHPEAVCVLTGLVL